MTPPQSIAHYRLVSKLGEGGMGAVYRATDTKLNRDVAVKILPDAFAADAERMARFQREAQLLASLNHPNIAHIYGVEERALILELVDGPTLQQRIAQGPIPIEEALPIARQIAEALEYAHERNIVHRDLKPGNICLTAEARVKVLDFGLAKAFSHEAGAPADPSNSPTMTMQATTAGVILGTASYMSPEQAKGKPVDRRADIWAFGVVLVEMLSGRRMYAGETATEILAAVITKEPDLNLLPPATPAVARTLLRRCLDKDPNTRLRDIGEARVVLQRPVDEAPPAALPATRSARFAWIAAALFALAATSLAVTHFRESPPPVASLRLTMLPPEKQDFAVWLALSPDGRRLAFRVRNAAGIWLRPLDSMQARLLAGTEGANTFFWSPDSRFLAFESGGKLKKIEASGGTPETICDFTGGAHLGGSWSADGTILFGGTHIGILRVPASGGTPVPVTALDQSRGETQHTYPAFLPDGRHFLYLRGTNRTEWSGIFVGSLDVKPQQQSLQRMIPGFFSFAYVPPGAGAGAPGRLLFLHEGNLMAQPLDHKHLQLEGEAVTVAEGIATGLSQASFTASPSGLLAYRPDSKDSDIVQYHWFNREGKELGLAGVTTACLCNFNFTLSPDETRVAHVQTAGGEATNIWVLDLARGVNTRLSFTPDGGTSPVWSPDGKWIAFSAAGNGQTIVYLKDASGGVPERTLLRSAESKAVEDWSRDGKFLVYRVSSAQSGKTELWAIPDPMAAGERKPVLVAASAFNLQDARVSPDGRWLAYASDESGKSEIYVRPFPPGDGRTGQWLVSSSGASIPRWRADGKELYFLAPDLKLVSVEVAAGRPGDPAFHSGPPHALLAAPSNKAFRYAVARDSKRLLLSVPPAQPAALPPLNVVMNWEAGLRK